MDIHFLRNSSQVKSVDKLVSMDNNYPGSIGFKNNARSKGTAGFMGGPKP